METNLQEEEKEGEKISVDSFTGSPGSPDLLTTVLAECDGTGTLDMRDQRTAPRVVHDEGSKEEEYRDLAHSCMSDFNFCDEIFNELEKTSTFPAFSNRQTPGRKCETSGNIPYEDVSR